MIAWSIAVAHASECFDQVLVSTDDDEIADVARAHGAQIPFLRPAHLADDHANTKDVISHSLEWIDQQGIRCDALCCLYATAPFVQAEDLRRSLQLLMDSRPGSVVFAATSFPFPIQRAVHIDGEGYSAMFQPECFSSRSQDLVEAYHDAGQFYWAETTTWVEGEARFDRSAGMLEIPNWRALDIDTPEDWERAEFMMNTVFT